MVSEKKQDKTNDQNNFRRISKDKYIIAGVITLLIFSLGITLGFVLDDYRYNLIEDVNLAQETKYLSLQMQYLYLNAFNNADNCPILSTTLKEAVVDLSESLSEVVAYEEEQKVSDARKTIIMRRYAIDNLRYWLLALESKKKCNLDIVPIIYFYSADCPSCPNQGTILTYFKKKFGEQVLVFPINVDLKNSEPMVDIVMEQFTVKKYPTLIIDNRKFEGVVSKEQLQEQICNSLENSEICLTEEN